MADRRVGLIRGINVGRARRVAMADLRAIVEDLGYTNVRTLLNSGNLVFTVSAASPPDPAARLEAALAASLAVPARVTVLTAAEIAAAVDGNPLSASADDPSRLLAGFLADPSDRPLLEPLLERDWKPEALALGARVAYMWCPGGVAASRLSAAVGGVLGDGVTARNWATVLRLQVLLDEGS